jgi:signal peptidase I
MGKIVPADKESNLSVLVIIFVFALIVAFVGIVPVKGTSMLPTIEKSGDVAIAVRHIITPDYGDIVILDNEYHELEGVVNDLLIKRVIAKGGDRVSLLPSNEQGRENEVVLKVNGVEVYEPYITPMTVDDMTRYQEEITVPEGCYYVLGDNRAVSADSRTFGVVRASMIDSVAVIIVGSGGIRIY